MTDADLAVRPTSTDVTLFVSENPVAILTDAAKRDAFYERVRQEVEKHVPDLSSDKGRKAIASLAFKVTKTKTFLDEAGKKLTEDKRAEIKAVDDARRAIRDQFDALRDEVRQPLTDWEAAEEARVARCKTVIAELKAMAVISFDDTSDGVSARLSEAQGIEIAQAKFGDLYEYATDARAATIVALTAGVARLAKEEADRAELARLRLDAEERAVAEEDRRRAAEKAAAAEAAEQTRKAQEEETRRAVAEREQRAEAERQRQAEDLARAAAEDARAEAERVAEAERTAEREAHQLELDRQTKARAEAEAEANRLVAEQATREREVREARAAEEARTADRAHRGAVMGAAKEAIMEHGEVDEPAAKRIVLAIASASIPQVSIRF